MPRITRINALSSTAAVLAIGASMFTLAGCKSDPDRKYKTDLDSLSVDLSPELVNTSQTKDESRMDWAVDRDQDMRSAWSDMGRFWLTDKPSRLSPYPIMPTGGNP
jgi:hypothetical protein